MDSPVLKSVDAFSNSSSGELGLMQASKFGFMIETCILAARNDECLVCPAHKEYPLTIRDIAPDLVRNLNIFRYWFYSLWSLWVSFCSQWYSGVPLHTSCLLKKCFLNYEDFICQLHICRYLQTCQAGTSWILAVLTRANMWQKEHLGRSTVVLCTPVHQPLWVSSSRWMYTSLDVRPLPLQHLVFQGTSFHHL